MPRLKFVIVGSLLALLLVACGSGNEEPRVIQEIASATATTKPAEPTNTPRPEPTATSTVAPTPTEEPEPTTTTTTAPTETPEPVAADQCLACHMDKDQLIATAAQVEEVPSENSGEG